MLKSLCTLYVLLYSIFPDRYAAIHQLGGDAGRNKKVKIPARPYINLVEDDYDEILHEISEHLSKSGIKNL